MAEAEAQQAVNEQQPQSEEIAEQNQVEQETQEISEVEKLQEENRKWQSMYDKATADNTKMQTIMADYLETQKNAQPQQQAQQENIEISEEEFNPWDAYYKPNSPSYKMRILNLLTKIPYCEKQEENFIDSKLLKLKKQKF